jgi:anhydro-N-acetylmuramic acid kinase
MKVIGIMSGTSMDGTDLSVCEVSQNGDNWTSEILQSKTYNMSETWRVRLAQLKYQNADVYAKTDVFYGRYLGELVKEFMEETGEMADLVASHGHTIYHDPTGWLTAQIGDGATLSATCGLPVVSNFRRADVALGGQGAPLAGMGDELLYNEYDACINLGGFCNISAKIDGQRTAWDIGPCNIVLNRLARERKLKYDAYGSIAAEGEIDFTLLEQLNAIPFYALSGAKSLGREWINQNFWHLVRDFEDIPMEDRMRTLVVHISFQIARAIDLSFGENGEGKRILVTGGGVYNKTLMEFIGQESDAEFIIPEEKIVDFKEAQIFALLGAMRVKNVKNINHLQTGAKLASIAGSLDGDFSKL